MRVKRYLKEDKAEWNKFIQEAKNATFLFHRSFMDYHADRFKDHSLMFYEEDQLVALLPANIADQTLYSHQGLSYGSFIVQDSSKLILFSKVLKACLAYLQDKKITNLVYKSFPSYYDGQQHDQITYLLYILKAECIQKDLNTVVDLRRGVDFEGKRIKGIKRARNVGLSIVEGGSIPDFWHQLLIPNLKARFDVYPTHNTEEILSLSLNFPENILQFNVYEEAELIAGATLFLEAEVIHTQYLSANERGRQIGALDLLIDYFINERFKDYKMLSFGISTFDQGRKVNHGLYDWKTGFGGKAHLMETYKIETKNHILLDNLNLS